MLKEWDGKVRAESDKRVEIMRSVIDYFLTEEKEYHPTISSINEGSCGDFAHMVNEGFKDEGLSPFDTLSTFDFISPTADGCCEYLKDWNEVEMLKIGVSKGFFEGYERSVKEIDERGVVGYHVWLFDGVHHYDATCLEGVKNPLELPFFKQFNTN